MGDSKMLRVLRGADSTEMKTSATTTGYEVMKHLETALDITPQTMEYFGLSVHDPALDRAVFVDLTNKIWKYNYKTSAFFSVQFVIKFFVRDVDLLDTEGSRDIYYKCIRHSILSGDIQFPEETSPINMVARALQRDFGDFDDEKHEGKYFDINSILDDRDARRVLEKYPEFEQDAAKKFHKKLEGTSTDMALVDFFRYVMRLPTYGIVWYPVDKMKGTFFLGIKSSGMVYYSMDDGVRSPVETMNWKSVLFIRPDGKKFVVGLQSKKKLTFTTKSSAEARYLFGLFRDSAETYKIIYRRQKKIQKLKMETEDTGDEGQMPPEPPQSLVPFENRPVSVVETKSGPQLHALLEKISDNYMNNVPSTEFDEIIEYQQSITKPCMISTQNRKYNRYTNVLAYDETRVLIPAVTTPDEWGYTNPDGYINANHVKVSMGPVQQSYVCCQGPKSPDVSRHDPGTLRDFWTMILVMEIKLIVMTTNLIEANNRVKCARYWPSLEEEPYEYGPITVTPVEEDAVAYYTMRKFIVEDSSNNTKVEVVQMQYTNWPDHGIPSSPEDMNDFVKTVQKHRKSDKDVVCIHCSAGIGRTGVTVMVDMMMSLLREHAPISMLGLAKQLRAQRAGMIQMRDQYEFLYNCLETLVKEAIAELPPNK